MGFTTNSLDLIRRVFRRDQMVVGGDSDVVDTMDFATRGQAAMSQAYGPMAGGVESYMHDSVSLNHDLNARYEDYEGMDEFPEISVAFDLFADDATVQDVLDGKSIWFEAPDDTVQDILNNMLEKQIRAEETLWDETRTTCKYGNNFAEVVALDQQGVVDLKSMYVPSVRRIQDQEGILYGFVHDPALGFGITTNEFFDRIKNRGLEDPMKTPTPQSQMEMVKVFEPWEVVHFRMRGSNAADIYGISIADASRYAWKRLMMMEDSMVVYKLTRAAQRYAFYIDVGDVPPAQAKKLLQNVKNEFKKEKVLDKDGKVSFKYSPMSADEDLFLAVRKDKRTTEVEVLSAPEGQLIEDVNYFKEKLIASLKVPKSYLAGDDTVGRANLAQLDVRMARSVMRVQRVMKNGYHQVGRVDLAAKNIDPDMVEFRCMMNIPSGVLEMAQVEVQNAKLDLAAKYQAAGFSQYFIWSQVLGLSEDDIQMIRGQLAAEQGATQGMGESVQRVITMDIDKGHHQNKKLDRHLNQIREEIDQGRTEFGKRMRELRLLMQEVKYSISTQRGVRWQPEERRRR